MGIPGVVLLLNSLQTNTTITNIILKSILFRIETNINRTILFFDRCVFDSRKTMTEKDTSEREG